MKKSEMISLMANVMEENFDRDNGNWEQDAEKVLAAMEKAGILPPVHPTKGYTRNYYQKQFNEWEQE